MSVAYVLSALSIIYGLFWLIFTFKEPPGRAAFYFRVPNPLYFLPERGGRFVMAVIFLAVIPASATFIISRF